MDRKDFLKSVVSGCCGAMLFLNSEQILSATEEQKTLSKQTPCKEKTKFTKEWIQRFMKVLDNSLDEKTRRQIMQANGKACYTAHKRKPLEKKMIPEVLVEKMAKFVGKENCFMKGNKIYFNYFKNPRGLKISDGYCLCPMVEDGPAILSPTYCYCSVGYVGEMFKFYLGKAVKVELLESLRTGGNKCRFLIQLS